MTPPNCPKAPATFKSDDARWKDSPGKEVHTAGVGRGLHRLRTVRGKPARPRTRARLGRKAINHGAANCRCARLKAPTGSSSCRWPEAERFDGVKYNKRQECATAATLFEFSGACSRLRRDAIHQTGQPVVRRPQRSSPMPTGLHQHLRRQPATQPGPSTRKGAGRPGPTRCSKTTPSLAWVCA